MAMTTCKECSNQVSTEARTCPHCGAAAPAKKKPKGGVGKWLLIVFAIGVVAAVLPKKDKDAASSAARKAVTVQSNGKKAEAKAEASAPDQCFYRGKALAGVYVANFSKMANSDVMASDVMREGCDKVAEERKTGNACVRSCEIGFKQEARTAFK
ncbi:hypothetical protein HS961_20740 [Comamonas piscis]|uniref:Zinc ribbon domain-containing protein n=1 Tax=Comamonas piscis TaxID=1562974 RepID=A0A7G5EM49_9BURK|nr:hypothetical protein [Comamonas piscis]QMV75074.1 hypothetical protein HS961_20740 [Comamonas piscis]WSO33558.1 hypothetical protein VUJ63_20805 [Comamonas piscis]